MCLGYFCAELNKTISSVLTNFSSIIYRPCFNGASAPVSTPIIDPVVSLFGFCFLVFLEKLVLEFLFGLFAALYPYLVHLSWTSMCLIASIRSVSCLGPSCAGYLHHKRGVSWILFWAERNKSICRDEFLNNNLPPLLQWCFSSNYRCLYLFLNNLPPLLQWCRSSCFYSNYRCLYLSWFLVGFLWSVFGLSCLWCFRLRFLICGFIHRIVRIRRKHVFFSWEDFLFPIYCVVSFASIVWMCLGNFCFLSFASVVNTCRSLSS